MKGDNLLLAVLAAFLVIALLQGLDIADLSREVEDLGANVSEVAAEREELLKAYTERVAAVEIAEDPVPVAEPEPAEPVFTPLDIELSQDLQQYTWEKCQEYGVPFEVVIALMWRESRFELDAIGYNTNGTQDSGPLQVNDVNRGWLEDEYGITDLLDPRQGIEAGIIILAMFWERYPPEEAVTAYGWGESGMIRWGVSDSAVAVLERAEMYGQ